MRRRDVFVGAAAVACGWRALAQGSVSARIGFIVTGEAFPHRPFDEALQRLGWIEGRNLTVDRHITGEDPVRRKIAAAELAAGKPDVIVAGGIFDALPVFAATHTIPLVVITGADLVENGLVESLSHPGGNVTGTTVLGGELDGKRLDLLHELVPSATRIAVLGRRTERYVARMAALQDLAHRLGIGLSPRFADTLVEMDAAYGASAAARDQGIVQMASPLAFENQSHIIARAAMLRPPVIYEARDYTEQGGLMSYGQVWQENFERSAYLVDRILKGAKPADLPVEQPTRFELIINLKTARTLGLTLPQTLVARADEVIE